MSFSILLACVGVLGVLFVATMGLAATRKVSQVAAGDSAAGESAATASRPGSVIWRVGGVLLVCQVMALPGAVAIYLLKERGWDIPMWSALPLVALNLSGLYWLVGWPDDPGRARRVSYVSDLPLMAYGLIVMFFGALEFRDILLCIAGPDRVLESVAQLSPDHAGRVVRIQEKIRVIPQVAGVDIFDRGSTYSRYGGSKRALIEFRVYPVERQAPGIFPVVWTPEFRYHSGSNAEIKTDLFTVIPVEQNQYLANAAAMASSQLQTLPDRESSGGAPLVLRPLNEGGQNLIRAGGWLLLTFGLWGFRVRDIITARAPRSRGSNAQATQSAPSGTEPSQAAPGLGKRLMSAQGLLAFLSLAVGAALGLAWFAMQDTYSAFNEGTPVQMVVVNVGRSTLTFAPQGVENPGPELEVFSDPMSAEALANYNQGQTISVLQHRVRKDRVFPIRELESLLPPSSLKLAALAFLALSLGLFGLALRRRS